MNLRDNQGLSSIAWPHFTHGPLALLMPTLSFNLKFSSFRSLVFTLLLYVYPPEDSSISASALVSEHPRFLQCLLAQHVIHHPPDRPDSPSVNLFPVELVFL